MLAQTRYTYHNLFLTLAVLLACPLGRGQSSSVPRDSEAVELARKSERALTHGRPLNDGVLEGKYDFKMMGAPFQAGAKLEFLGDNHSRVFTDFDSPLIIGDTEICTVDGNGVVVGIWTKGHDAASRFPPYTLGQGHWANCWAVPVWFSPGTILRSIINDPQTAIVRGNKNILRAYKVRESSDSALWQSVSTSEIQLDPKTGLPTLMRFWCSANTGIPVPTAPLDAKNNPIDVSYSDYREVDGIMVPFGIAWSRPGSSLTLSLTINAAHLNVGLTPSNFALPASPPKAQ